MVPSDAPGRVAVEHDRGVEGRLRGGVSEASRASPAEPDHAGLAVGGGQLLSVLHGGIEPRVDVGRRQRADRLTDLGPERFGPAPIRPLAGEKVGDDRDEAVLRQLIAHGTRGVRHPADVVDDEHDAGLRGPLRVDDPRLQERPVGHLDVGPFAVAWRLFERARGMIRGSRRNRVVPRDIDGRRLGPDLSPARRVAGRRERPPEPRRGRAGPARARRSSAPQRTT